MSKEAPKHKTAKAKKDRKAPKQQLNIMLQPERNGGGMDMHSWHWNK